MLARRRRRAPSGRAAASPFFLTVFFSTAHFPYAAPAPYLHRRFTDARSTAGASSTTAPSGSINREEAPDQADIAQVRGLYDGAVASIDAASARILGALDKLGLGREHDRRRRRRSRRDALGEWARRGPRRSPVRRRGDARARSSSSTRGGPAVGSADLDAIVRDVDLAPTLYELLGVADPPGRPRRPVGLVPLITPVAERRLQAPPRLAFHAETGLWFTEDIAGFAPDLRIPYPGVAEITEVEADHHDDVVLKKEMRDLVLVAKHRMVRDDRYKLLYLPNAGGRPVPALRHGESTPSLRRTTSPRPARRR